MESIWTKSVELPERPPLEGEITADVAVIGGGLAGVLTAFFLQEKGYHTVVLEASRIGSGQTKNTTAKITSQHGLIYGRLLEKYGEAQARHYASLHQEAIGQYERLAEELNIPCDFSRRPAYLYTQETPQRLKAEAAAAGKLGIDAEFTMETELPFEVAGALKFSGQAQFHPLIFLKWIADRLTVYENTRVIAVEENRAQTERGAVRARHIVFATHYPFINVPGFYFAKMHQERSYVIALENTPRPEGMYLGIDSDGLSFRSAGEYLLLGGGSHRTGENSAGGKYDSLRRAASRFYPDSREAAQWSAQDCVTLDGIPYIGPYCRRLPGAASWFVATGFRKWGMTTAMVSARILSNLIETGRDPAGEIFSPLRFYPDQSVRTMLEEGYQAVKGLSRRFFTVPAENFDHLPNGHGGIVSVDGEKVGVYKDEKGEIYTVNPRCPHLGCQVEWNPDEKSWDCPCHGSRFDYTGKLLDNPAEESL